MEIKTVPSTNEISGRQVIGFAATTGVLDLGGDITHRGAFKKTIRENKERIRHLWQHDYMNPPIAAIEEIKEVGKEDVPEALLKRAPEIDGALMVKRRYLDTPRAEEVFQAVITGVINEMSFGYDPIKFDFTTNEETNLLVRHLREVKLYDTSDVNWGMNPFTQAMKSYIPYQKLGIVAEPLQDRKSLDAFGGVDFDELSEKAKLDIAAHFTYSLTSPIQKFDDLKLLHHQPTQIGKGVGQAHFPAVVECMAQLVVGVKEIPLDHLGKVYAHLSDHYKEYGKVAPSLQTVVVARTSSTILENPDGYLKEGRVLSNSNLKRLKDALAVLTEILLAAEPQEDDEKNLALTLATLNRLTQAKILSYTKGV